MTSIAPSAPLDFAPPVADERDHKLAQAVLTATCLASLLAGLVLERVTAISPAWSLSLYVVAYVAGGAFSTLAVVRELRRAHVTVDFLMLSAALAAAAVNEWPEGAFLLFLFSLSNTLEAYILGRTRHAIRALMDLAPETARVRRDQFESIIPVTELRIGDTIIVRPSERIPADAIIRSGRTSLDQSPMTGESIPVDKGPGDEVLAGTLNLQGAIEAEVTRLASDTTLARMVRLVVEAQAQRAHSQRFTEWFGSRYTIAVLAGATLTFLVPVLFLEHAVRDAFYRAATVLVVASPCAVVISIPATILAAITGAARGGVLFKGGAHVERAAAIDAVAIDKTGTLTLGKPEVTDVIPADDTDEPTLLAVAAAAEARSEHPLAHAVVQAARQRNIAFSPADSMESVVGHGVRAAVGGQTVLVGKRRLLERDGIIVPPSLLDADDRLQAEGKTVFYVGRGQRALGLIAIADTLRESAAPAIDGLRRIGIHDVVMLTGDNERVAESIARRLGIEHAAQLLPEDKLRAVKRLRDQHRRVAMVGDGVNDAPSMAASDLAIAIAGTDVALETADAVLMGNDLRKLPAALAHARRAQSIIYQNLIFAFTVMLVLLTLTLFFTLPMPFAVIGHEGSTVLVIVNGLRLIRLKSL